MTAVVTSPSPPWRPHGDHHPHAPHPPADQPRDREPARCLPAGLQCEVTCALCADACLNEREHLPHLTRCITLNAQCAAVCHATAQVLAVSNQGDAQVMHAQLTACLRACQACAEECERHAQEMNMAHCAVCAESCRRCAQACQALLDSVNA